MAFDLRSNHGESASFTYNYAVFWKMNKQLIKLLHSLDARIGSVIRCDWLVIMADGSILLSHGFTRHSTPGNHAYGPFRLYGCFWSA